MHQMTQSVTARQLVRSGFPGHVNRLICGMVVSAILAGTSFVTATAGPPGVATADIDYEASGFVTPAGMVPPEAYRGGVAPVGFLSAGSGGGASCDAGCDSSGQCSSCQSPSGGGLLGERLRGGGCGLGSKCGLFSGCGKCRLFGRCRLLGGNGLLGGRLLGGRLSGNAACGGCGMQGCRSCGGLTNLRHLCMFCRGGGCSACQFFGRGYLPGALRGLLPYSEAGMCAQRWYDLSAEALFLSHDGGGPGGVLATRGIAGTPVLSLDSADSTERESGVRLSAAMIFGAGGNLEVTYMGGQEWDEGASAFGNEDLFSFISEFGTDPPGGFDDTDRSNVQSVEVSSEFHSGELNYRRRTVGPYCRFQGSWLVGLRYLNFDHDRLYSAVGSMNNTADANELRFFSSNDELENSLFGAQSGFDLWWNAIPGIQLGIGSKLAWMQNDIDRRTTLTANSIVNGGPGMIAMESGDQDTTVMGEFQAKMIYRLSHSWAFRGAIYVIGVDEVGFGTTNGDTIRDFVQFGSAAAEPTIQYDELVLEGASFGAEYTW